MRGLVFVIPWSRAVTGRAGHQTVLFGVVQKLGADRRTLIPKYKSYINFNRLHFGQVHSSYMPSRRTGTRKSFDKLHWLKY